MRKSKLTSDEILEAEKAKDDRTQSRAQGFAKMKERDAGHARIRDYNRGREVWMHWGFDDNLFKLEVKGRDELVLDAEEVRRSLRWV